MHSKKNRESLKISNKLFDSNNLNDDDKKLGTEEENIKSGYWHIFNEVRKKISFEDVGKDNIFSTENDEENNKRKKHNLEVDEVFNKFSKSANLNKLNDGQNKQVIEKQKLTNNSSYVPKENYIKKNFPWKKNVKKLQEKLLDPDDLLKEDDKDISNIIANINDISSENVLKNINNYLEDKNKLAEMEIQYANNELEQIQNQIKIEKLKQKLIEQKTKASQTRVNYLQDSNDSKKTLKNNSHKDELILDDDISMSYIANENNGINGKDIIYNDNYVGTISNNGDNSNSNRVNENYISGEDNYYKNNESVNKEKKARKSKTSTRKKNMQIVINNGDESTDILSRICKSIKNFCFCCYNKNEQQIDRDNEFRF